METTMCEPCQRKGANVLAVHWCTECEEALCSTCYDSHRSMKVLMAHNIVPIEIASVSNLKGLTKSSTQFCKKHKDLKIEYHCKFHDTVCCQTCMTQNHRACSNVVPIDVSAKGSKSSSNISDLLSQLASIDKTLEVIRQKKIKNIKQLDDQDQAIRNTVSRLRQKVTDQLDLLEKDLFDELSSLKKTAKGKLDRESRKINQSQNLINAHKDQIEFERSNGSDRQTFILAHLVKEHLISIEEKIFRMKKDSSTMSIVFSENHDLLERLDSLGSITLSSNNKPANYNGQDDCEQREAFIQRFDVAYRIDTSKYKDAMITGITSTDDNRLLLCGGGKCNVVVCTSAGNYLQDIKLAGEPWDVAVINHREGKAAATLPYLYGIQFINLNSMVAGKMIKFDTKVYGIAMMQKKIVVGGKNCLKILSNDGIKLQEITVPSINVFYIHPRENGDIYYSDCSYVYCMKPDGRHVFCQNVSNLEGPRSIITDTRGNLYVAGHRSDNVHRLSSDGIAIDIPLTKADGIKGPFAICFSKDQRQLFVSNTNGTSITVYKTIYISNEKETEIQDLLRYL